MLVEMAVADAYAIAWEFARKKQPAPIDFTKFLQHPTYAELLPGQYTDDTQRAIANIDVMLHEEAGALFTPIAYAESYVAAYNRDRREGYSRGFQALLKSVSNGGEFLTTVQRTKASNGSVMGVAPLGLIGDMASLKVAATIQAITSHHPATAIHAQIIAMSAHYFAHCNGDPEDLQGWIMNNADWVDGTDDSYRWSYLVDSHDQGLGTSIKASSISSYVVYAVTKFDKLTHIIHDAIDRGGDTDSAAASAVAVASLCPDIENDIPQHLIDAMDAANPGFGVDYLRNLEAQLRAEYKVF